MATATTQFVFKQPTFYAPSSKLETDLIYQKKAHSFKPHRISLKDDNIEEKISEAKHYGGVFELTDLGEAIAPFAAIKELFKKIQLEPNLAERANTAYVNNLVYKDAYGKGMGGAEVDEKRVIDLSPQRLDTIVKVDEQLAEEFGQPLKDALHFFDHVRSEVAPKILTALSKVVGDPNLAHDGMVNYRMVDYPERLASNHRRELNEHGPRCGAHRDFGTFTLIFSDGVPGLEILLDNEQEIWRPIDLSASSSAVLLFGWCANIRSNDRVPAVLHRVADAEGGDHSEGSLEIVPRRLSAVFFLAPASDTKLTPKLMYEGEKAVYQSFTAGELKNVVGRKWKYREGTLFDEKDLEEERNEAKFYKTQDDVIAFKFKTK